MTVSITPRGTIFARVVRSLAIAGGGRSAALRFAESQGHGWMDVVQHLRAAVSAISQDDFAFNPVAFDLAEYLRPLTIIGRLAGLRRVPFDVNLYLGTAGARAAFVAEGAPIPATDASYTGATLRALKVGAIVALSKELVLNATPNAEATISAEVGRALVEAMDLQFIDPTQAGVAGESPASVTYGATQIPSSGSSVALIDADLEAMVGELVAAQMTLNSAVWVMTPSSATRMSLMRGSSGAPAYPQITARGGMLCGLPVVTSTACGGLGSPTARTITLLEAGEILLADDGGAALDYSDATALQMDSAPGAGPQSAVSMFQTNSVAIRAVRQMNWQRRRDGAAVVLTGVTY